MWNCPIVPQGGIVAAAAARAMTDELAHPEQTLRSLSVVFAGPVRAGPVEVEGNALRRGRRRAAGAPGRGGCGAGRGGFEFPDARPPEGVLPAHECPSFRDDPPDDVPR